QPETQRQLAEAYRLWLKRLASDQQNTADELRAAEPLAARAQQARDQAKRQLDEFLRAHHDNEVGYQPLVRLREQALQQATAGLQAAEARVAELRAQQQGLPQLSAEVERLAAAD